VVVTLVIFTWRLHYDRARGLSTIRVLSAIGAMHNETMSAITTRDPNGDEPDRTTSPTRSGPRRTQVLEALREDIMTGRLANGERLIEEKISAELGTSRGPVREALRQLEHEGLVISYPYRGAIVSGISDEEVYEVLIPIRLTLERYAFVKALDHLTDEDFAELGKQLWVMEESARVGELQRIVEADLRFHEIVLARSERPHAMQVWQSIWPRIRGYFFRYGRSRPLDMIAEEHRQLLTALQTRDAGTVLAVLDRHIAVPRPELSETPADVPIGTA
jgi:DNA-binding GntR family transcriptional regulator